MWKWLRGPGSALAAVVMLLLLLPSTVSARGQVTPDYEHEAGQAAAVLQQWYDPSTGLYSTTGWWQAANAVNALIDYSRSSGSRAYLPAIENTFNQAADRPPCGKVTVWCTYGHFLDNYFDDDQWWALTWLNAYDLTGNRSYLEMTETIFDYVTQGWDSTCGGGLWWNVFDTTKNVIPNELFLLLSGELYQHTGNRSYLSWALSEWAWFSSSGMIDPSTHLVAQVNGTCPSGGTRGATWTYIQGVIAGGLATLDQITQNHSYLSEAEAIADAAIRTLVNPDGILVEPCASNPCKGSAIQFKGIFERNLYRVYETSHNPAYRSFIERNANSVWTNDRDAGSQLGLAWQGPFDAADASRQSSALDALNAAIPFTLPPVRPGA